MVKKLSLIILGLLAAGIAAVVVALGVIYGNTDSGTADNASSAGDTTVGAVTPDNGGNSGNNANASNGNGTGTGNGANGGTVSGNPNGSVNGSNGAPSHICSFVFDSTVAPDCVNGGYDLYKCSCGATDNRNPTSSLGHNHVWTVHNATCTSDWSQTGVCTRCGDTQTQTVPNSRRHTYGAYTYNNDASCMADGTETATCSSCGATDSRAVANTRLSHTFGAYISNNDATCIADGTKSATCSVCGARDTVTDTGSMGGGHKYGGWTMMSVGDCRTHSVSVRTCAACGQQDTETGDIGAHQVTNGTCTVCNTAVSVSSRIYFNPEKDGVLGNFGRVYLDIYIFSVDAYCNMTFDLYIGQEYTDVNGNQIKTYKKIIIETSFDPKNIGPYSFELWSIDDNSYITFGNGMDYDCWPNRREGRFWLGLDSTQGYGLNEFFNFTF